MVAHINEFYNKSFNWPIFSLKLIIFFNIIGILSLFLEKKDITYEKIIIYTLVSLFFSSFIYIKHIKKIMITNEKLIVTYNYKILDDFLFNFNIKEKIKQRGLIRYYRLVIKNKKTNKTIKIDSDEWFDYEKIKEVFIGMKLLENRL